MSIQIVQSRTGHTFRRSGTEFPAPPLWLGIDTDDYEDDAAAILAEPKLQALEVTDTDDTDLIDEKDIINPDIIPPPD